MSEIVDNTDLPQGILLKAAKAVDALVPEKTRRTYEKEYFHFEAWLQKHCVDRVDETVLMAYFQDLSESYSPNSLWTKFSMLRKELIVHKKIRSNEKLITLQQFLKQIGKNYQPKKSKVLTREQVITFLKEAPDEKYLADKVVLVIGVFGACRRDELVKMKFSDVRDMGQYISIDIPQSKNGQARSFLVIEESEMCGLKLIREYLSLRPKGAPIDRFFVLS